MPSSKIKNILKWILVILIALFLISSISGILNDHDSSSSTNYDFNISHDNDDSNDISHDYKNNSNIESDYNSNKNYEGVDDSPYEIAKNDPDWYYDHYDYGDYDEIDEYLESQGY